VRRYSFSLAYVIVYLTIIDVQTKLKPQTISFIVQLLLKHCKITTEKMPMIILLLMASDRLETIYADI
jgi:hypothetical protein